MKAGYLIVLSSFLFSLIGLLAAWGIGVCTSPPSNQRPVFQQTMFIVLPLGGAALGWVIAYCATPFRAESSSR